MVIMPQPYCQARHPAQKGAETSRSHCAHKHCWNCHRLSSCSPLQFSLMIETVLDSSPSVPLKSWLAGMSKVTILSWTLARLPATKFSGISPGFNETKRALCFSGSLGAWGVDSAVKMKREVGEDTGKLFSLLCMPSTAAQLGMPRSVVIATETQNLSLRGIKGTWKQRGISSWFRQGPYLVQIFLCFLGTPRYNREGL